VGLVHPMEELIELPPFIEEDNNREDELDPTIGGFMAMQRQRPHLMRLGKQP